VLNSHDLGHGITCIDADYVRQGLACYYLLQDGGECALIDTGTSQGVPGLLAHLAARGLSAEQVRYVIPTHVHLDHAGAAGSMMAAFPRAQLLIHPRGARHMADPAKLIASAVQVYGEPRFEALYGEILPVPAARIREMADGERVRLGRRELEFRHTRGHANHHFCLWDAASQGWFSGDMFGVSYPWFRFAAGDYVIPTTTPTQFDPEACFESLALLDSYRPQRMYLTHSGALDYTPDKRALLERQIEDYVALARESGLDGQVLEAALLRYSLQQIRRFAPAESSAAELGELLAFDIDLNAQGLRVWLERDAA
jgi:glyoxylase-like metal-dependent hydrolase (beta-lactamase superfamily II)